MSEGNPISPKVYSAAAGAGAGAIVSQLIVWLIGAGAFGGGWSADRVDNALAAVPSPLNAFILLLVIIAGAAVGAYVKVDPLRLPTLDSARARELGVDVDNPSGPPLTNTEQVVR